MDALFEFLDFVRRSGYAQNNLLGLLHILIGRRLEKADGTLVSLGVTWRTAARLLKKVRWDPEAVRQVGLEPASLPPRDRERYWYSAVQHAHVDSDKAVQAAEKLAAALRDNGYCVSPPPGR
jgi:hypothetical protein